MRVRTVEIRWHESKPINSCDFQPIPFKKARPTNESYYTGQSYRLATGGEDNNVRIWMVYPNILPPSVAQSASSSTAPSPHPPRVEYLATLSRHSAPVNVVRFSPSGDLIASAGDDGMIIIWTPSISPHSAGFGSDADELQYEKEYWKARTPFRCTTMQVYDLAWSPTGEYIIAGSTDNTARIFSASDGKCIREIAEHSHFVQGVAWDPLNEFVATQSSDRSVHVYSISTKQGLFDVHAIGKNAKMAIRHSRTPSVGTRPRMIRRESAASDAESAITSASEYRDEIPAPMTHSSNFPSALPLTPAPSVGSTPSTSNPMFLPPADPPMSRRSSFSSNAPGSPSQYSTHIGRSPSPMPPLPAIRAPPSPQLLAHTRLYGDENFTNFFRRLTFSPDGGLLLTPSGHFEDQTIIPGASTWSGTGEPSRGRKGHPSDSDPTSASSVYIYSRANFARPPIAHLPGHKKPSVAVKFSPVLYELRPGVVGAPTPETKHIPVERGNIERVEIDLNAPLPMKTISDDSFAMRSSPRKRAESVPSTSASASVAVSPNTPHPSHFLPSPALSAVDLPQVPMPRSSTPAPAPTGAQTGSIFALPYRMLFAVATMDTITIHDTQQAGPICLLTKLHYDEFTDMAWSPDGQCLMLTSRDGYCTIVIFDEIIPTHHTQQHSLQLQSIAHAHSSHSLPTPSTHRSATPSISVGTVAVGSPVVTPSPTPAKRSIPLPSPIPSTDSQFNANNPSGNSWQAQPSIENLGEGSSSTPSDNTEPPKKKRRVALTRVADLSS